AMPLANVCSVLPSAQGLIPQLTGELVVQTGPGTASGTVLEDVTAGSRPSRPKPLEPQHRMLPPAIAQVWRPPAAMAWAPLARLVPVTGRSGDPATPSSPALLSPQHRTSPPVSSAQLWLPPTAIATTPPVRLTGWTGWAELETLEPSPSWLKKLPPQH